MTLQAAMVRFFRLIDIGAGQACKMQHYNAPATQILCNRPCSCNRYPASWSSTNNFPDGVAGTLLGQQTSPQQAADYATSIKSTRDVHGPHCLKVTTSQGLTCTCQPVTDRGAAVLTSEAQELRESGDPTKYRHLCELAAKTHPVH